MTAIAMLFGAAMTLVLALLGEGVPTFSLTAWLLIVWLAVINTALTYTLWAESQRSLRAVESSVLGDLTIVQIALLGWVVLGEGLDIAQIVGEMGWPWVAWSWCRSAPLMTGAANRVASHRRSGEPFTTQVPPGVVPSKVARPGG